LLSFVGQVANIKVIDVSVLEPILQREEKNPKSLKLMVSPEKTSLNYNEKTEKLRRRVVKEDVTNLKYLTKLSKAEAAVKYPA
jgi:hypothetical protein